ncbi:hypothetical protein K1719_024994 [Acacia pycnantha]|nr:hypothetical protein K1719_024994 [Acacia pycnantha]
MNSLQVLNIESNNLQGEVPKSLGNICTLKSLSLGYNNLSGDLPSFISNASWCSRHRLQSLYLGGNRLTGILPNLLVFPFLQDLDLSGNQLKGKIPESIGLMSQLKYLYLDGNNLGGVITESHFKNLSNLVALLLSGYSLTLKINPSWIPPFQLQYLTMPSCMIGPNFPNWLRYQHQLSYLDISDGKLSGSVPNWFWSLLEGEIPSSIGHLVNMQALVLKNNSLTGELPSSLVNCSKLLLLDVSENKLSGSIPSWIGKSLRQLEVLSLRMNHLNGCLPMHLCHLTQIRLLDLSHNKLSSEIPSCLQNFTVMAQKHINLTDSYHSYRINKAGYSYIIESLEFFITLTWKGEDQMFKRPELFLKSIDLSNNALTGEIPKELVSLLGLVSLNLSRNQLSGEIPMKIGNLESLEFLDLSKNKLSGQIPPSLAHIDRLSVLDLSNNSLSGKIPTGTQLQSFNASSYDGNFDLCGLPLNKKCPGDNKTPPPQEANHDEEEDASLFSQEVYLSMGLGFFVGFWAFVGPFLFNQTWRQETSSHKDLLLLQFGIGWYLWSK